jgi:hypothetical protein
LDLSPNTRKVRRIAETSESSYGPDVLEIALNAGFNELDDNPFVVEQTVGKELFSKLKQNRALFERQIQVNTA